MSPLRKPVVVSELSDSGLIRQRWIFTLAAEQYLLLDRYHYERRRSLNQEFKTVKFYDRSRKPDEEYGDWQWLEEAEVPWTGGLKNQARNKLIDRLGVLRSSDLSSSASVTGVDKPYM
jgi:hypothetical protein